jgi:hypothetical protein
MNSNLLVTAESEVVTVPRNGDLYKARQPTTLRTGAGVRLPIDEDVAPGAEERWFYGRVTKVYPGGELVDVELDNGEGCKRIPTWEVFPA